MWLQLKGKQTCLSPDSDFKLDLSKVIENLKGGEAHSFLSIQNEFETDKQNTPPQTSPNQL